MTKMLLLYRKKNLLTAKKLIFHYYIAEKFVLYIKQENIIEENIMIPSLFFFNVISDNNPAAIIIDLTIFRAINPSSFRRDIYEQDLCHLVMLSHLAFLDAIFAALMRFKAP